MLTLKMKKVRPGAIIPKRATSGSAGLDLCACTENEVVLKAGERTVIPTGIAIAIENNETAAFVYARSGLGIKHGISLSNGVGVIDSDYRGEAQRYHNSFQHSPSTHMLLLCIRPVSDYILNFSRSAPNQRRKLQSYMASYFH